MLIETKTFDGKYYVGRTYMDIPEEDGLVFIPNTKPNLENTWVKVKITAVKNYDLIGQWGRCGVRKIIPHPVRP